MRERFRLPIAMAAAASFFVWGVLGVLVGSILPQVTDALALSSFQAGMIFVVWSAGFVAGSAAAQNLLQAAPAHRLLLVLSVATGAAALAQTQAQSYLVFTALYGALGLFGGAVFTSSHTLYGALYPERRTSALASLDLVFSAGNIAAPLLVVALIAGGLSWRVAFALIGAAFLLCAVGFAVAGRVAKREPAREAHRREAPADEARPAAEPLDRLRLAALALGAFGLGATEWAQHVWFVTYALAMGADDVFARLALSAFTAGMVVARVGAIAMGDALRSASWVRFLLLLAVVSHATLVAAPSVPTMLVANLALGLGIGALLPVFLGLAMDGDPARGASFSAVMIVSLTLGGQAASFTIGALAERADVATAYAAAFGAVVIMAVGFETFRIAAHRAAPAAAR